MKKALKLLMLIISFVAVFMLSSCNDNKVSISDDFELIYNNKTFITDDYIIYHYTICGTVWNESLDESNEILSNVTLVFELIDSYGNVVLETYDISYLFMLENVYYEFDSPVEISKIKSIDVYVDGEEQTNSIFGDGDFMIFIPIGVFLIFVAVVIIIVFTGLKKFKDSGALDDIIDDISNTGSTIGDAISDVTGEIFKDQETRDLENELKKTKLKNQIHREQYVKCGYCGSENRIGSRHCSSCGAPIETQK